MRKAKGADVLRILVEATDRPPTDTHLEPAVYPGRIARDLGIGDGRAVSGTLNRLVDARLADRGTRTRRLKSGRLKVYKGAGSTLYTPTERGREVDRLLAGATAARGGTFTPWSRLPLTTDEVLALR